MRVTLPWPVYSTGAAPERRAQGHDWWGVEPVEKPGLKLLSAVRVRDRLYELTFSTPDVPNTQEAVRILLPSGYNSGAQRYPTLYLLHGCCNGASPSGARNWTDSGKAEALTLHSGAIVVMPDGGNGGMYVDWFNGTWLYESFVIDQLLPWVDLHLRTIPRREDRAIAGLSMGGFGTMYLGARHPDLFSSEGAFSGIVDTLHPAVESSEFDEALAVGQGGLPGDLFGNLASKAIVWHEHNPGDLAVNLTRSVAPFVEYGDPPIDPVEDTANLENKAFASELEAVGIDPTVVTLPLQGHSYTVWNDGLKNFLAIAEDEWHQNLGAPDGFTYTSAAPEFSAYNYTVKLDRPVVEFATLGDVTAQGFRLTGTGKATVTTARRYAPGHRYRVRSPGGPVVLVADSLGRLSIPINLGPSAAEDEFSPPDTGSRPGSTVQVAIKPLPAASA